MNIPLMLMKNFLTFLMVYNNRKLKIYLIKLLSAQSLNKKLLRGKSGHQRAGLLVTPTVIIR